MIRGSKLLLAALLVLSSMLGSAQTSVWTGGKALWADGSGTESDPFLITSADNLAFLAYMVNKGYDTEGLYFRLVTDIDLNGEEGLSWEPIGLENRLANEDNCERSILDVGTSFRGCFDGDFHSISNINVENGYTYAGLFGSVAGTADNPVVIENVFVISGSIQGNNSGGIIGNSSFTRVSRCKNGATVVGAVTGGIVGCAVDVSVNNCYNTGFIDGIGDSVGGSSAVGGLVGVSLGNVQAANSYNIGEISSDDNAHCIVGYSMDGTMTVENCHFLNSCGQSDYGTSHEEAFMRTIEFVNLLNSENDELVWAFDLNNQNNGFPFLAEDVYSIEVATFPIEGGVVSGGGPLAQGTICALEAVPSERFVFMNWMENEDTVSYDTVYSFTVEANRSLVACFALESYEITTASNPLDAGSILGDGNYLYGDTVTLIAIPNDGFLFNYWTENDSVVSGASTYTFTADCSRHIVADFSSCANAKNNTTHIEVFPNPVHDFLFIRGECINDLMVLNTLGQVVDHVKADGQEMVQISMKNKKNGVYYIKICIGNCCSTIKVLKQ